MADRVRLSAELSAAAFDVVWASLREREAAVGRLPDLERARFILGRLYPELAGARLTALLADLATRQSAGTWHGFTPPESFQRAGGQP